MKTSAKDELREVDDIGGLMSRRCPIRFIITKQALQEGWDCPFAYVLTILTNPSSRTGITQLVGRILRQPHARKTGNPWLDESYVFCFRRKGHELLEEVRRGFGLEGLKGLEGRVVDGSDSRATRPTDRIVTRQRTEFRAAARDLVLPAFMIRDGHEWRLVRYEADILSRVPWERVDIAQLAELPLGEGPGGDFEFRANLAGGELVSGADAAAITAPSAAAGPATGAAAHASADPVTSADPAAGTDPAATGHPAAAADPAASPEPDDYFFAASHLLDLVPNRWRGRELARRTFEALLERHPAERVAANRVFILEKLRARIERERDRLSREVFGDLLESGRMRFLVVTEDLQFNRLPPKIEVPKARQANREDGGQFQRNLFDITTEDDLNPFENKVATYLDQQARLFFWYRNRARKDYYVQGWKPRRIYADFILTLKADEPDPDDGFHRVYVVETKGVHLKATEDTDYKRSVFDLCTERARKTDWAEFVPAMQGRVVRFEIVDEEEWRERLHGLVGG